MISAILMINWAKGINSNCAVIVPIIRAITINVRNLRKNASEIEPSSTLSVKVALYGSTKSNIPSTPSPTLIPFRERAVVLRFGLRNPAYKHDNILISNKTVYENI